MTYALFIRDIELTVGIGLHDFEKAAKQRILVSVTLLLADHEGGDAPEHVYDYDRLMAFIRALQEREHTLLQETICRSIVQFCEGEPAILGGVVQTQKPDVYRDARTVGCRMAFGTAGPHALLEEP